MPDFWSFSTDTEGAFGGIKLPPLVGYKINVRLVRDAMNVSKSRVGVRALRFKIRFQILRGENFGQRFAPNHAALAVGIFEHAGAVALAPQFLSQFFHLGIALRKISEAGRMLRTRADDGRTVAHQIPQTLQ